MSIEDYFYYFNRHGHEFIQERAEAIEFKNTLDNQNLEYEVTYETDDDAGYLFERRG